MLRRGRGASRKAPAGRAWATIVKEAVTWCAANTTEVIMYWITILVSAAMADVFLHIWLQDPDASDTFTWSIFFFAPFALVMAILLVRGKEKP